MHKECSIEQRTTSTCSSQISIFSSRYIHYIVYVYPFLHSIDYLHFSLSVEPTQQLHLFLLLISNQYIVYLIILGTKIYGF